MEAIKNLRMKMREKGVNEPSSSKFLHLGEKMPGGGVKSTGKHIVTLLAEPVIKEGQHFKTRIKRQELHFRLEEGGEEKLWSIPIYKLDNTGSPELGANNSPIEHYLIPSLENIKVGEAFSLELKASNGRNYVEVGYPLSDSEESPFSTPAGPGEIDPLDF